jgi:hypothetical protein
MPSPTLVAICRTNANFFNAGRFSRPAHCPFSLPETPLGSCPQVEVEIWEDLVMPWAQGRGNRDLSLTTKAWRKHRIYWKRLRLPCARCRGWIDYDGPRYLPGLSGRRRLNPRYLVVGHIVSRHQARRLGWSEAQVNALSNTQPECQDCSNRSGARLGRLLQEPNPMSAVTTAITAHRW